MNNDKLKLVIQSLMSTDFGREYVKEIIKRSSCLDDSICFDNVNRNYYLQGKKTIGQSILNDIQKYSYKNYEEMIRKD